MAQARPSEAAVERCFSKNGSVLKPKRNRLSSVTVTALLKVAINYNLVYEWTECTVEHMQEV